MPIVFPINRLFTLSNKLDKMAATNPTILYRDGKKAFVILPYEEFVLMEEELQNFDDLKTLREAKTIEADATTIPLSEVKKELGL